MSPRTAPRRHCRGGRQRPREGPACFAKASCLCEPCQAHGQAPVALSASESPTPRCGPGHALSPEAPQRQACAFQLPANPTPCSPEATASPLEWPPGIADPWLCSPKLCFRPFAQRFIEPRGRKVCPEGASSREPCAECKGAHCHRLHPRPPFKTPLITR